MKIALYVVLVLCTLLILVGVSCWCLEFPILVKLSLSGLCVAPGVAYGGLAIDLLTDD